MLWHALFVSPSSTPSGRNWFRISWLVTIIAIGLRNPYAKSESGAGLVLYDVYCPSRRLVMVTGYFFCITGSKYLEYNSSIRTKNNPE
jgi:hypothetical protein